jgi:hypothetical protein
MERDEVSSRDRTFCRRSVTVLQGSTARDQEGGKYNYLLLICKDYKARSCSLSHGLLSDPKGTTPRKTLRERRHDVSKSVGFYSAKPYGRDGGFTLVSLPTRL